MDAAEEAMNNYDALMDELSNDIVESFMPCRYSGLQNGIRILYRSNYDSNNHPVVFYCSLMKKPYFTCCTYKANVECVARHVCSFLPVIIGSKLDRKIVKHLYPTSEYDKCDISDLYGTIYIDSPYCFSNLLTNRKELIHRIKRNCLPEVYELFIYDQDERGHKLSMDNSGVIVYRNRSGKDEVISQFNSKTSQRFKLEGNFSIDERHLMLHHIHEAFNRLYEHRINIDSLCNKNIMSPVNILHKAIQYSRRNDTDVAKFMKFGMIEKFASLQISYQTHNNSRNNAITSNYKVDAAKFNMTTPAVKRNIPDNNESVKRLKSSHETTSIFQFPTTKPPTHDTTINQSTSFPSPQYMALISPLPEHFTTTISPPTTPQYITPTTPEHLTTPQYITPASPLPEYLTTVSPVPHTKVKDATKKKKGSKSLTVHESFNFKKIQPNQLGAISRTWYRHVVRPIPKNVPNIPIDTEFFLCMAEKSMSIDSPNRWMVLLDDIFISNHLYGARYMDINTLLVTCHYGGYFVLLDEDIELIPKDCIVVMVNGGLLTRFVLAANVDNEKLFFYLKTLNPFIEVYMTQSFLMLNQTDGIPFRRISVGNQVVFVSPLELMTSMRRFRSLQYLDVLGPNCPPEIKDMIAYVTPSKLMSIVYFRNRFDNINGVKFFPLMTENTCAFIDNIANENHNLYNKEQSIIKANVLYSSNPQLTGDGYIMSDQIKSCVKICKRYSIEFTTNLDKTNFIWPQEDIRQRTRNIYNSFGMVIARRILVMNIIKFGTRLSYKIFPQIRLKIHEKNIGKGQVWAYRIEYWDDNCESFDDNFQLSVISTTTNCRRKEKIVHVAVIASFNDYNFDFKLSEMCGQKGIAVRQDTSRFQQIHKLPSKPDVVSSIFSVIGRSPLIQLKCLAAHLKLPYDKEPYTPRILYGSHNYGILKNITSSVNSYNPMRIDWSLGKVLVFNNCCRALYRIQQDSVCDHEKGKVLTTDAHRAMALMGIIKCCVRFEDEFGNHLNTMLHLRRQQYDDIISTNNKKKEYTKTF